MKNPTFARVENERYDINTSFRVAIECSKIAEDETIGDYERALAIIYLLYGDKGLENPQHYNKLLEIAKKYLMCGKENVESTDEPDMDYEEDMRYIEISFMSDYGINLSETDMHWWEFNKYIEGLSNSELGDCCVLNRIRNLRTFDTKEIKDRKEKERIEKAKKQFALKKNKKENHLTKEQEESMKELNKMLGL